MNIMIVSDPSVRPPHPIAGMVLFEESSLSYLVNINGRPDGWRVCDEHGRRLDEDEP